jgi:hypothetical protein
MKPASEVPMIIVRAAALVLTLGSGAAEREFTAAIATRTARRPNAP